MAAGKDILIMSFGRSRKNGMQMIDTKQPRVMHVLPTLHSSGGAEQLVYRMVRNMINNQYAPIVCCINSLGDLGLQLRQEGVKVYCRQQTSSLDMGLILWMSRIIREEKVQVVHAHMYQAFEHSVPAALISRRAKVVYTVHGRLYPEKRLLQRRIMYPLWSLGVDRFVSISEKTRSSMAYYDFHPEKRIDVIHNGIEISPDVDSSDIKAMRISLGLDENSRILGTAARLEDIKNIPMMLRAMKRVLNIHPHSYLLVAGDGSKLQDLKQYSEELDISRHVLFLGLRNDLRRIYPLFDVFLLSSFTEGISVSLLEAMSYGIPAVVTDVGGNSEVVFDGETGYLVPSDDDAAMAEKIMELLDNKERAVKLGCNGRDRAQQHFSFTGMMEEYTNMYRSLCGKS
jgi:glycosyltransferase involved in cell wall biosynthesis